MLPHLYTRAGDDGYTYCAALNRRILKSSLIIEFIGTLDEANSFIGLARSFLSNRFSKVNKELRRIQDLLFKIGFSIAKQSAEVTNDDVRWLEEISDQYYGEGLKYFVLPSGPLPASALHVARTIVRRAERCLVRVLDEGEMKIDPILLKVLNRASDVLFAMALWVSRSLGYELEPVSS